MKSVWQRLVRFGFRLLYNELAWTYDIVSWFVSLGAWRDWQRAALPYLAGKRVLEIAHGPGHMLLALEEAGFEALGVDLSPQMGRLARSRLRRAGVHVPLLRADVTVLPLAADSFDSALATFPTDFIAERAALQMICRVVRPGGRLVIVPEGHLIGRSGLRRFIGWLYAITGQRWPDEVEGNEPRLAGSPTWALLANRMRAAGFTVQLHEVRLSGSGVSVVVAEKRLE